ncbi:MAG TPA: hypothetical protein VGR09_04940 [Gemmatimonadales bacterium]|nr:hypothetical protein [Gemmatimonadales bacterium]
MNFDIRRKLDMAGRVRDFCRTHGGQNPGHTDAVARLEERLARAEALAKQEVAGRLAVAGAVVNKEQLRQEIQETVALLAGLAGPAAREEPELAVAIARPRVQLSHQVFLTRARVAADTGSAHKELLARYGMPENFLTDLGAALDNFERALNEKHMGRAAHVGARAELEAVTSEIMLIVRQLDALNRFHFRKDAESLAAWKSARDVAWPAPPPAGEGEKSAA